MAKYCSFCGTELDDDALFCGKCGKKIEEIIEETKAEVISSEKEKNITFEETNNLSEKTEKQISKEEKKSGKEKIIIIILIAVIIGLLIFVISLISSNEDDIKPNAEDFSTSISSAQSDEIDVSTDASDVQSSADEISVSTSSEQLNKVESSVSTSSINSNSEATSSNKNNGYIDSSKPDNSKPDNGGNEEENEENDVPHSHNFGNWTNDGNESTHSRVCECGEKENETHVFDSGNVTEEPTETTTGTKIYTCIICGATKTEILDKLEHTHNYGSWTDDGNGSTHSKVCSCGDKKSEQHNWTWWEYSDTTQYRVCIECGANETKEHVHDIVYDDTQPIYKWRCRICGMSWMFDPNGFKKVIFDKKCIGGSQIILK